MDPVAVIRGRRKRETDINWNACFICQGSSRIKEKTVKPTDVGRERFRECVAQRQRYQDLEYINTLDRVQIINYEEDKVHMVWHKSCYAQFTHANHIQRLQKRYEKEATLLTKQSSTTNETTVSEPSSSSSRPSSRTSVKKVSWERCLFCQEDRTGKKLRNVATFETSEKIIYEAQKDALLRCRLAGVSDLIAAEGKYHLPCYTAFMRKFQKDDKEKEEVQDPFEICFKNVIEEVQAGLTRGNIYTMTTIWEHYCSMLERDFGFSVVQNDRKSRRAFKHKVKKTLQKKADFIPSLNPQESLLVFPAVQTGIVVQNLTCIDKEPQHSEEEDTDVEFKEVPSLTKEEKDIELLSWLYRVSVKIRADINVTECHSTIGDINNENAEKVVPESLFLLLSLVCGGEKDIGESDESTDEADEQRTKILSIGQDIVSLASGGRKHTPKQLGLGLTIHQATRSKDLVKLLHAAGHSVSYETVRRADTALANEVLARYAAQNNTPHDTGRTICRVCECDNMCMFTNRSSVQNWSVQVPEEQT